MAGYWASPPAARRPYLDCSLNRVDPTPLISVVIPCYNAARYIAATIESVLAQDMRMEVIVIDDGSTDGSADLVRLRFPGVRVLVQANQGVAAARNHGLRAAHGEWIAFVDADDIWLPGKLAAQFQAMRATASCRMSYTAWHVWPSDAPQPSAACLAELAQLADTPARWTGASGWIYAQLLLDCVVWTSTVLMHTSVLKEIGAFDSSLRVGEDYDLWLRASRVTAIVQVPRPYALYRMHPASITRSVPEENYRAKVIGRALAKWGTASPDGSRTPRAALRGSLAKSWCEFAYAHLQAGNNAQARAAAWSALRLNPGLMTSWKILAQTFLRPPMPLAARDGR